MVTWLHISDLHFRTKAAYTKDQSRVLDTLLEDVRQQVNDDGLKPDLIIVSGDIGFTGDVAEYQQAADFFDKLLLAVGRKRDRLFVVPGNHDLNRDRGWTAQVSGIRQRLQSRKAASNALADAAKRLALRARFDEYYAFCANYLGRPLPTGDELADQTQLITLDDGKRIGLLGLNSAWVAYGGARDQLRMYVGEDQAQRAIKRVAGADLTLAVMHHPFTWLRGFDQDDCEPLLAKACPFILHGHLHRSRISHLVTAESAPMVLAAGAVYEAREAVNAFNWVSVDLASGQGTVHLMRYSDAQAGFWAPDTLASRKLKDGVYQFCLSGAGLPVAPTPGPKPKVDAMVVLTLLKRYNVPALQRLILISYYHLRQYMSGNPNQADLMNLILEEVRNTGDMAYFIDAVAQLESTL